MKAPGLQEASFVSEIQAACPHAPGLQPFFNGLLTVVFSSHVLKMTVPLSRNKFVQHPPDYHLLPLLITLGG